MKKSGKKWFFLQNSTSFPFMSMVSDSLQKSLRTVHEKMPNNQLQETFFRIELSLLLFELCHHEMLQTRWIILYIRGDTYYLREVLRMIANLQLTHGGKTSL